jgi:DNA-directed RNA polymerase specialized sigma subunit
MANEYLNNKNFESIIKAFQHFSRQKSRNEMMIIDLRQTHERRLSVYEDNEKLDALNKAQADLDESNANYKNCQEQLAYAFYILSQNIANYAKFSGIDVDDAIQEGVLICFEKINKFDPRKGKAFNYLTTCIINSLRQSYRSSKNHNELIRKYSVHLQDKLGNVIMINGKERFNH